MTPRIGQINVLCSDLARSLAFYRDVLGFTAVAQEGRAWHLRCGERSVLLLGVADAARPAPWPSYGTATEISFDLMVDDIAAAHAHLADNGATFASAWQPGHDHFFVRDPDGNVLEVIQDRASPPSGG